MLSEAAEGTPFSVSETEISPAVSPDRSNNNSPIMEETSETNTFLT